LQGIAWAAREVAEVHDQGLRVDDESHGNNGNHEGEEASPDRW
jgi:hypothetical protein